jgi:tetratricopeptide (TPR) repeat protein
MLLEQTKIESLFDELANDVRSTANQTRESIVQTSHRRLATHPHDEPARHLLAVARLHSNDPDRCLSLIIDSPWRHVSAVRQRILAYAYLLQSNVEIALGHLNEAVRLDPAQIDCWTLLGQIHEEHDNQASAIEYYRRGMVFDQCCHEPAIRLSRLHFKRSDLKEAVHTLRIALMRDQRSAKLNTALGRLLQKRAATLGSRGKGQRKRKLLLESLQCFEIANSAARTADTLVDQGRIEQRLERYDEARTSFEQAIKIDPGHSVAISLLANANVDCGQIDLAIEQFESVLASNPKKAANHFRYSRAKKFRPGVSTDAYLKQLTTLIDDARPGFEQVQLNFAAAKVLEDLGRYDEAWKHYDRANRLKRGHSECVLPKRRSMQCKKEDDGANDKTEAGPLEILTDDSLRLFTPEFFDAHQRVGNPDDSPIFIVGMPRSGTTLTEQILSSHTQIAGAGELKTISQLRSKISQLANDYLGSTTSHPEAIAALSPEKAHELSSQYLMELDRHRSSERHVTDKMPTNFAYLGMIAVLFPNAKIVHCRRNPMDVLVSCYCQNLSAPFCDLNQLTEYHHRYRRLMSHWESVLPTKIHTVDYELMVANPEENTRALIDYCGLNWDPACLNFHKNNRQVHTPSKCQVRNKMYRSSVEKWRRYESQLNDIAKQFAGVWPERDASIASSSLLTSSPLLTATSA